MAVSRLHVDAALRGGQEITLDAEQSHYIARVLRLRQGDSLTVFNAEQGEFTASIVALERNSTRLLLGRSSATAAESPLKLHLVQGISRGDRMDFVVQKATELGVKRITPVLSDFGVVKLDPARAAKRRQHWQKVAVSACEQSGRVRPPLVESPLPLRSWLAQKPADADIDLVLLPDASTALAASPAPEHKLCLLVGPEGGFSPAEREAVALVGFTAVALGPRVLRTETAAVAAIAIAQLLWGDLGA